MVKADLVAKAVPEYKVEKAAKVALDAAALRVVKVAPAETNRNVRRWKISSHGRERRQICRRS